VKYGVPQGSVLGPLLYIIYINDLPLKINTISDPILFADDTSVIISKDNYDDFKKTSNLFLSHMCEWFDANQVVLNVNKTNIVKFTTTNLPHYPLAVRYADKLIKETTSIRFLGTQINNHLNWKSHIDQVIPKLSAACFAVRRLFHILNTYALWMVYFSYFHSVIKYGIIFWQNSTDADRVFILQKRTELWLVLDLEVHVEAYLRNWISYLSDVNTYFH
jgi:hypothetical protein